MIYLFSTIYSEAAPLIQMLNLKKDPNVTKFQFFSDEQRQFSLTLTGTGKIAIATAVSFALKDADPGDCFAIFFGSAASIKEEEPGTLYQLNKVTDLDTGRSFYPDMIWRTNIKETAALTSSMPLGISSKRDIPSLYSLEQYLEENAEKLNQYQLLDMESSAFLQTAFYYLRTDQVMVFRFVSDNGNAITEKTMRKCAELGTRQFCDFLKAFTEGRPGIQEKNLDLEFIQEIAGAMRCTRTMEYDLRQYIHYAELAGIDWKQLYLSYVDSGKLPVHDKEEGKKVLHEYEQHLSQ